MSFDHGHYRIVCLIEFYYSLIFQKPGLSVEIDTDIGQTVQGFSGIFQALLQARCRMAMVTETRKGFRQAWY